MTKTEKACIKAHIIRCLQWSVCVGSPSWGEGRVGSISPFIPDSYMDGLVAWSMYCDDPTGKALVEAHYVMELSLARLTKLSKIDAKERIDATFDSFLKALPEKVLSTLIYWGKKGWRDDDEAEDSRRRFEGVRRAVKKVS